MILAVLLVWQVKVLLRIIFKRFCVKKTPQKVLFVPNAHTELRGQLSRSRGATLVSGNLTGNSRQDISGISARVYKNGTYGFASMAEYRLWGSYLKEYHQDMKFDLLWGNDIISQFDKTPERIWGKHFCIDAFLNPVID